jgi:uncharacterized protein (TIGR02594 family)
VFEIIWIKGVYMYPWYIEAKKHVGLKEIPGIKHNPTILSWLKSLKAWWSNDEEAWCGTYAGHCLKTAGVEIPKFWMRALAYDDTWGVKLDRPIEGCIVTFSRKGGGHVGFVAGTNKEGQLIVLGGNQNNMVNYATFDKERVVGYYLPKGYSKDGKVLPVITSKVEKYLSEA